jgi:hypothetical protein
MRTGTMTIIWRATVILGLVMQSFLVTLRTPWGMQHVPPIMVRIGLLRPWQAAPLLVLVHPPGVDAVSGLAREITEKVPPQRQLLMASSGAPSLRIQANLRYLLYPRSVAVTTTQSLAAQPGACQIDWPTQVDATLTCPEFTWRSTDLQGAVK